MDYEYSDLTMKQFVLNNLDKIPYKCLYKTKSKKTIILLAGTGGDYSDFDDVNLPKYYDIIHKSYPEIEKYKNMFKNKTLNFQKELSKHYTILSFTPFEFINTNIYDNNKEYEKVEPNKYFFETDQMVYTLKCLLNKLNLQPPYILVGFSEGGWRSMIFSQYLKNVEKCILIDPQRFVKSSPENIGTYEAYKLIKQNGFKKKLKSEDPLYWNSIIFYKYKNLINKFKLQKNSNQNIHVFLNIIDDNNRILSDLDYINKMNNCYKNIKWYFYLDQIHALHIIHFNDIINTIIK